MVYDHDSLDLDRTVRVKIIELLKSDEYEATGPLAVVLKVEVRGRIAVLQALVTE